VLLLDAFHTDPDGYPCLVLHPVVIIRFDPVIFLGGTQETAMQTGFKIQLVDHFIPWQEDQGTVIQPFACFQRGIRQGRVRKLAVIDAFDPHMVHEHQFRLMFIRKPVKAGSEWSKGRVVRGI
jgi:hypothetical protein